MVARRGVTAGRVTLAMSALAATLFGGTVFGNGAAWAKEPLPWQMWMQPASSPIAQQMHDFHTLLMVIIVAITLFVAGLLGWVMIRYNARANPVPSKTSHNTMVEIAWTIIPILILLVIAIPSFRLLYDQERAPEDSMVVKVIGHQWYWSYEYPDEEGLAFDSYMIQDADLKPEEGHRRLLSVDNPLVVPVGTNVRVQITSTDVIHSWLMPGFGVQRYAMPGRVNEQWFRVDEPGTYYGQCNQICGFYHAYMPIEVRVLSAEDYAAWLAGAKEQFAKDSNTRTRVARAEALN